MMLTLRLILRWPGLGKVGVVPGAEQWVTRSAARGQASVSMHVVTVTAATPPAMAMLERLDIGLIFPAALDAYSSDGCCRLRVPAGARAGRTGVVMAVHADCAITQLSFFRFMQPDP